VTHTGHPKAQPWGWLHPAVYEQNARTMKLGAKKPNCNILQSEISPYNKVFCEAEDMLHHPVGRPKQRKPKTKKQ
jgi:hypothetical protein